MAAIDWGSVPTWFSAIGTTGSLIATVTIVLRDRRKDEREDAACFAVWTDPEEVIDYRPALRLHNAAGRPVFDVTAHFYAYWVDFGSNERGTNLVERQLAAVVRAGAEMTLSADYAGYEGVLYVTFRDAHQVSWRYDMHSKTLTREPESRLGKFRAEARRWARRRRARIVGAWRRRRSDGGEPAPEEAS
ncbi:hypothetical protein [Streptomyces albogriseolus]|uniref:hypothetical protein n=1 Tax=Streptomyces albogriseolus TaxID=1887 RepID=UPI003CED8B73